MPWTISTGGSTEGGSGGSTGGGAPRVYVLNMIDTPGHVDFTYEVSRSLAACEGAVLLVDAAQGIEAQTLANLYLAIEADLHIIPVLNKIDLPSAQPEKYAAELAGIIGCDPGDVLRVSAKTGEGVTELLDEIVAQVPAPVGDAGGPRPSVDLRLGLRHLPRRGDLCPGGRRRAVAPRAGADDVDQVDARGARGRGDLAGAGQGAVTGCRRGRLPDHRRQGRPTVPGGRHRHLRWLARRPRTSAATGIPTRWSSPGSTRWTPTTTRSCARRWTSCSSTTPRWSTSRRRPVRSGSGSGSASSGCCTWRSSASGSSASSTSI